MASRRRGSVSEGFVRRRPSGNIGLPKRVLDSKGPVAVYKGKRYIKIGPWWFLEKWLQDPTHSQHGAYKKMKKDLHL